jgi:hypothetical protein
MVEMMKTGRDDVVGFRARGTLGPRDVEKVVGVLDAALQRSEEISVLADLTKYDAMTVKGLLRDLQEGVRDAGRIPRFKRVAIVGPQDWVVKVATVEVVLLPGVEVRAFAPQLADEARAWAAEA